MRGDGIRDANAIREWLREALSRRAGLAVEAIDDDAPFAAYGLASPQVAEIGAELAVVRGEPIDVATLFAHPTVNGLSEHLVGAGESLASQPAPAAGGPADEPLAIVGLGCRMPGAHGPDELWELLTAGGDAVTEVPPDRWDTARFWSEDPAAPGRTASKWGGFIDGADHFDAGFFGILGDEADRMDPQQRLLMETAWEALEDAGRTTESLSGSATSVFVGISVNEYGRRQARDVLSVDAHMPTGNALAIAANRLSYAFDLRGPSVAVDTACSSSLVALHLARRSLLGGESELAIAAGVNLLLDPEITIALGKAGMLARDGRCKTFDARADGYVRGEGCGVVVLRRLSDAQRDGDRIYAVVRGSAVGQDGRSNGLTAPNPLAQQQVVRTACAEAGVPPAELAYVECHGTGTYLGDPIEASALGGVMGSDRDRSCLVGSIKANVGHLESAAGVAGLLKVALCLHYGAIPPSAHFSDPHPNIDFDALGLRVPTAIEPWPEGRRLAGVSSFGFGGTNAHAVLEAAPDPERSEPAANPPLVVVPLSARTPEALERLGGSWSEWLPANHEPLGDVAFTASVRRTHHATRMAAVGRDSDALWDSLVRARARAAGRSARPGLRGPVRIAFVFSGQGDQWAGMGRGLLHADPLFTSTLRRCDEALAAAGFELSTIEALDDPSEDALADTAVAQPLLVALQIALGATWRAYGIEPAAVVGHSLGELAAAQVAGCLTLPAAVVLAAQRGAAMAPAAGGRMLAVGLAEEEAAAVVARFEGAIELAAVNGPSTAVLAGDSEALDTVRDELVGRGRFARSLPGRWAFHSRQMAEAAERVGELAEGVSPRPGTLPFVSTVTGGELGGLELTAAYWQRNARQPVLFRDAIDTVLAGGAQALLEVGPHATLRSPLRECAADHDAAVLTTLERGRDGDETLLDGLAQLYELGCLPRWERLHPHGGRVVTLPSYPWAGERHWLEVPNGRPPSRDDNHPFLGARVELADGDGLTVWEGAVDTRLTPFIEDHRLGDGAILPAAAFVDVLVAAARRSGAPEPLAVRDLRVERPLPLNGQPLPLQVTLRDGRDGTRTATVHSRDGSGERWVRHARATIAGEPGSGSGYGRVDLAAAAARCEDSLAVDALYEGLAARGLRYGPAFRTVRDVRRNGNEAVARVTLHGTTDHGFECDPRLLDGAFQVVGALAGEALPPTGMVVPGGIDSVIQHSRPPRDARVHAELVHVGSQELRADVRVLAASGVLCVEVSGLRLRVIGGPQRPAEESRCHLYETEWRERPPASDGVRADGRWVVLEDEHGLGAVVAGALERAGAEVLRVVRGAAFERSDDFHVALDPTHAEDIDRLVETATAGATPLRGVVHMWGYGGTAGPERAEELVAALARLVRSISFAPSGGGATLVVATRGAQCAVAGDACPDPLAATLGGLVKVLPFENPLLRPRCVDLDGGASSADDLVRELLAPEDEETEIAWRGGTRLVRRLVPAPPGCPVRGAPPPVSSDGTYVVTGGLGALGLACARWLADRGARSIALLGRHAPSAKADEAVEGLRRSGAEVTTLAADVASEGELAAALTEIRRHGPLRGVIHAAGVLDDGPLVELSWESVSAVMRPKVAGGWNVFELTRDDELDWLVLFSSAAAVLGSPGQANYCAANAFLDSLAMHARARGLRALSIGWGPWAEAGMAAETEVAVEELALQTAVNSIAPAEGVRELERALADDRSHAVILGFDLRDLLQYFPAGPGFSLFEDLAGDETASLRNVGGSSRAAERPDLPHDYVAPRSSVEERIAGIWQRSLGMEPIGVHDGFFELGGDSVFANQIVAEVNRALGVAIDPEDAFLDFTVESLARLAEERMVEQLSAMSSEEAARLAAESG